MFPFKSIPSAPGKHIFMYFIVIYLLVLILYKYRYKKINKETSVSIFERFNKETLTLLNRIFSKKKKFMFYVFSEGKTSKLCEILHVTRFGLGKRFFLIP